MVEFTFEPTRRLMRLRKMTGEELSQLTGVSRAQISDVINDKVDTRISTVIKMAIALDAKSLDEVVDWRAGDEGDGSSV